MGKYLHKYDDFDEFEKDYYNDTEVTFDCSLGTFSYDSYSVGENAYVWVCGERVLMTYSRTPKVGPFDAAEGTGAYDPDDDSPVAITAVNEAPGKYIEPWVSATTEKRIKLFNSYTDEMLWYDYVGEADVYEGGQS